MSLAVGHHLLFVWTLLCASLGATVTIGLGIYTGFLVVLSAFRCNGACDRAVRFWARLFALHLGLTVAGTGLLALELAIDWNPFWRFAGVVMQPAGRLAVCLAAMAAIFLFFGLSRRNRLATPLRRLSVLGAVLCTVASAGMLIAIDAWLQHPVAYATAQNDLRLRSFPAVLRNSYAVWEYLHAINGGLIAAAFLAGATGAWYRRRRRHADFARLNLRLAVAAGLLFCCVEVFPSGAQSAAVVARDQPITLAAIEGQFHAPQGSPPPVFGLPDSPHALLRHPMQAPGLARQLVYGLRRSPVRALASHARDLWPPVKLTWFSYHLMAMAGLLSLVIMLTGALLLSFRRLETSGWFHRLLLAALPLPFIANAAGWLAALAGRQPWLVYDFMQTAQGVTPALPAWESIFGLWGCTAFACLLTVVYFRGLQQILQRGPEPAWSPKPEPVPVPDCRPSPVIEPIPSQLQSVGATPPQPV